MTVFGHPVLFDCLENKEATASEKTPMQWHTTQTFIIEDALERCLFGLLFQIVVANYVELFPDRCIHWLR